MAESLGTKAFFETSVYVFVNGRSRGPFECGSYIISPSNSEGGEYYSLSKGMAVLISVLKRWHNPVL